MNQGFEMNGELGREGEGDCGVKGAEKRGVRKEQKSSSCGDSDHRLELIEIDGIYNGSSFRSPPFNHACLRLHALHQSSSKILSPQYHSHYIRSPPLFSIEATTFSEIFEGSEAEILCGLRIRHGQAI
jgi:hypothetical protein